MRTLWLKDRARARRGPEVVPLDDPGDEGEEGLAGRDPAEAYQASRDLRRVLATLSDEHRLAVLLVDVEGLTYAEAARVLSSPVGTVRSRLSRARGMIESGLRPGPVPGRGRSR